MPVPPGTPAKILLPTETDIVSLVSSIPGVLRVAVAMTDEQSIHEIHIIAEPGEVPKRIVRAVEVVVHAAFDILVDYRRIAVVVLGAPVW